MYFYCKSLCILIVVYVLLLFVHVFLLLSIYLLLSTYSQKRLPWLRFFRAFSSVVRQMPGYNQPRRGTARTLPKFLCCSMYYLFCIVLCIFLCKCTLYFCHRVTTQLQFTNISYHIIYICVCVFTHSLRIKYIQLSNNEKISMENKFVVA